MPADKFQPSSHSSSTSVVLITLAFMRFTIWASGSWNLTAIMELGLGRISNWPSACAIRQGHGSDKFSISRHAAGCSATGDAGLIAGKRTGTYGFAICPGLCVIAYYSLVSLIPPWNRMTL